MFYTDNLIGSPKDELINVKYRSCTIQKTEQIISILKFHYENGRILIMKNKYAKFKNCTNFKSLLPKKCVGGSASGFEYMHPGPLNVTWACGIHRYVKEFNCTHDWACIYTLINYDLKNYRIF